MKFIRHKSHSGENLCEVVSEYGHGRLMLDCGARWPVVQEAFGFDFRSVEACFLTHEHQDHCKAVKEVMRQGIETYASTGTWLGINKMFKSWHRAHVVANGRIVHLEHFNVYCFDTEHDAIEPLGFVVFEMATEEYLLFVTDSAFLEQRFPWPFSIIAMGCNYDRDILQARVDKGDINEIHAKRLLKAHASLQWVGSYLKDYCILEKCRQLYLLHCSGWNLDKNVAKAQLGAGLYIPEIL